jgi:hypothetical protein
MGITPNYTTIGRLFHAQYIFRVPKYQRNYAWTDQELEDFVNDIMKCYSFRLNGGTREHFFGGIVSVLIQIPGSSRRHCEIVDGQQRLSTFIILVACLISLYEDLTLMAKTLGDSQSEEICKRRLRRLKDKYIEFEDEINRQVKMIDRLEMSGPDKQFFKDKINRLNAIITRESHKRIDYAFKAIRTKLQDVIDSLTDLTAKLDAMEKFEIILDADCSIIHIVSDTKSEAYRLFQVLNDRGTSLTEGDLLRARTLELLDNTQFSNQQQTVETIWDDILADHPGKTDNFLRWYYSSIVGKRPGTNSLLDEFIDEFFPQHKKPLLDVNDANEVVASMKNIHAEIVLCRKLIEGEWPFPHSVPVTVWHRNRLKLLIKELEHTHCIPLLLAACKLDHVKFSEIVQMVERFFFRYKLICNCHIGPLTKLYLNQSKTIRENPIGYSENQIRTALQTLINKSAEDSIFRNLIEKLVYNPNGGNKALKYFLVTIEHYLRWYNSGANGRPQCLNTSIDIDFSNITIEHIYPQNVVPSLQDTELEPLVNTLGNLTVLGPNDNMTAANRDFTSKKQILSDSLVLMNNEIASKSVWDKDAVRERHERLKDITLKVFRM